MRWSPLKHQSRFLALMKTFVVIDNLRSGVEYQFQVVAVAELDGDVVMGERSAMSIQQIIIPTPITTENSECECMCIYNYFLWVEIFVNLVTSYSLQ